MPGSSNKTEEEQIQETITSLLKRFSPAKETLIPILQAVQAELGYIPQQAITDLAFGRDRQSLHEPSRAFESSDTTGGEAQRT